MDEYLTTADFANLARVPDGTIRYWRHIGFGPAGFRLGRRVLYRSDEVRGWIESKHAEARAGGDAA